LNGWEGEPNRKNEGRGGGDERKGEQGADQTEKHSKKPKKIKKGEKVSSEDDGKKGGTELLLARENAGAVGKKGRCKITKRRGRGGSMPKQNCGQGGISPKKGGSPKGGGGNGCVRKRLGHGRSLMWTATRVQGKNCQTQERRENKSGVAGKAKKLSHLGENKGQISAEVSGLKPRGGEKALQKAS